MSTLHERVRAWCAQHPSESREVDNGLGLPPLADISPVEGAGYLMREQGTCSYLWFDFKTKQYRVPAAVADELLRVQRSNEPLTFATMSENLRVIQTRMREVAKTWGDGRPSWDIMLDVESFGDCLPSLAIVPFDLRTGETMPVEGCALLTLDIDWQMRAGLLPDQSTLQWWLTKTSDKARAALYDLPGSYHCRTPDQLADYFIMMGHAWGVLPEQEHHQVWGKPASYDWPRVERLCKAAGIPVPFHFRTSRCLRTLSAIGTKPTKQERDQWKADNGICSHDPYDDCRLQAWEASQALRKPPALEQPHGGSDGRSFYPGRFYRFMPESLASVKYVTLPICRFITTHPEDGGTAIVEVFNQGIQDTHYINADWDQLREEADHLQWLRSI